MFLELLTNGSNESNMYEEVLTIHLELAKDTLSSKIINPVKQCNMLVDEFRAFVIFLATIGLIISCLDILLDIYSPVTEIDGYELVSTLVFISLLYGAKHRLKNYLIPFLICLAILIIKSMYKTFQMVYLKNGFDITLVACDLLFAMIWFVTYQVYCNIKKETTIIEIDRTFQTYDIHIPMKGGTCK